jgi:hypothetical protein
VTYYLERWFPANKSRIVKEKYSSFLLVWINCLHAFVIERSFAMDNKVYDDQNIFQLGTVFFLAKMFPTTLEKNDK